MSCRTTRWWGISGGDLWKVIDRDDPEYRDDLEGLLAGELAELTGGYGRLGVLAWEEGDF